MKNRPLFSRKKITLLLGLTAGFAIGLGWFLHLLTFDVTQRLRGDAFSYLDIAARFNGWGEALSYVGRRSVGFPLLAYLWVRLSSLFLEGDVGSYLTLSTLFLFLVHVSAVLIFFFTLRKRYPQLHWALGALLLAYPGLIAHTTVPLTDTFCADLLMLALALLVLAQGKRRGFLLAGLAGAVLAFAALCRPSYHPAILLSLAAFLGLHLWVYRSAFQNWLNPVALLAMYLLVCAPAAIHCASRFGQLCLSDPHSEQPLLQTSLINGLDSPRLYFTSMATPEEMNPDCGRGCRVFKDELLTRTWAAHCKIDMHAFGYGLPRCFLLRPDLALLFLSKKTLALFDSYIYQDYTVDVTPAWARLWSRPFSALAYAGFMAALVLSIALLRQRPLDPLLWLASLFTVTLTLSHSLTHIEGRYGYGAIPGALLVFIMAWNSPRNKPKTRFALVALAILFILQTTIWDSHDTTLKRIEAAHHSRE